MIRFKCPHCKKQLQAKDHLAGKKAKCTNSACQKPILIPVPPAAKTATTAAAPPPAEPQIDVDAIAAAALHDEPANGTQATEPADTIEFKCELCDHAITVPVSEAGKRMQCPNPECRSLVKVPAAKDGKPKALPTVAQLKQTVEKLDEAAWGSQTDKGRVTTEALKEAGAIAVVKKPPRSPRERIRMVLWTIGIAAAVVLLGFAATRVTTVQGGKNFEKEARKWVEPPRGTEPAYVVTEPVVKAAVYRAIAEYKLHQGEQPNDKVLHDFKQALASLQLKADEKSSVERDLFLGELAVSMSDLGGSERDEINKEKYNWQGRTLREELARVLEAIRAPAARTMAMRAMVTQLLKEEQPELAIGLAAQLSNVDKKKIRPPATSQLIVLLLLKDKGLDQLGMKTPNPAKGVTSLARVGFAEFHTRKGDLDEAKKFVFAPGSPAEKLEACVGVAQVLQQMKGNQAPEAGEFAEAALQIVEKNIPDPRKVSPWLLLQTIRVVARAKGASAVADLPRKLLPSDFQPRGYLEIALGEAEQSKVALGPGSLSEIDPKSPSLDLGWEALARQNARLGARDMQVAADDPDSVRFRPMVYIGNALGRQEPK